MADRNRDEDLRRLRGIMADIDKQSSDDEAKIIIKIDAPNGTLIVGDHTQLTNYHGREAGLAISAKQSTELDATVTDVAMSKKVNPQDVWAELCIALDI